MRPKLPAGIASQPIKASQMPKTPWEVSIIAAKEFPKTTLKRPNGSAKRLNKAMPKPKAISGFCMNGALAWLKIQFKPSLGIGRRLRRVWRAQNTTWERFICVGKVCQRISLRPSSGIAAIQGDAHAQSDIGLMYQEGDGVLKDASEAIKWYRKAADQGNEGAQFNLGLMYKQGDGVAKDPSEAVKWFRKAADKGFGQSQVILGSMYDDSELGAPDLAQAIDWYVGDRVSPGYGPVSEHFLASHLLMAWTEPRSKDQKKVRTGE